MCCILAQIAPEALRAWNGTLGKIEALCAWNGTLGKFEVWLTQCRLGTTKGVPGLTVSKDLWNRAPSFP